MSRTNSLPAITTSTADLPSTIFTTSQPEPPILPLQPLPPLPQPQPSQPPPSPTTKHSTSSITEPAVSSTANGSNSKEIVDTMEAATSQPTSQVAISINESKTNGLIVVSSTPSFSSTYDDKTSDILSDQHRQHHHHHHQGHQHHQHHHHHHHQHHHHHHHHQGQGLKRQRSIKTSWYLPNWEASAADTLSPAKLGGTQKQRPLIRRTYSEASTSSVIKIAPASIASVATTTNASAAPVVSTSTLQSETLKFDYSLLGKDSNIVKYAANDEEFRKTFLTSKEFEKPTNEAERVVFESSTTKETSAVLSKVENCCCCCSTFPCSCEAKKSLAMMSEVIIEEDSSRRESEERAEVTFDEQQNMATYDNDDDFIWTRSNSSSESSDEGFMMGGREERRVEKSSSSSAKKTTQRPSSLGAAPELDANSDNNYKEKSPLHEIARIAMEIAATIADGQDSRSVASAKDGDNRNFIKNSCRPKDEAKADKRIDLVSVRCETADEEDDAMDEISLMHSRYEKIPMTDFSTEIRASVDVENFLSAETSLILDAPVSSLEAVVECLLRRTLHAHEMFTDAFQDAKKSFFIQDSVCQLSRTIQNRCRTSSGKYEYEQSWLCILGSLATIQRRNVAIARLKSATNLGKTSRDVRFVILVVTPTKEKGTKNALELGRTFSTLFADTGLRLKLLAAESEFEFKLSLRQHVKQLSRAAKKTSTEGEEMASPVNHESSHQSPPHHHHHHHRHHHHHQHQLNHQQVSQPSGERSNLAGMGMVKKRFGGSFKHPSQKALADQVRRIKSVRIRRKLDNSVDRPLLLQKSPQLVLQHFDLNSQNNEQQQQQQRQPQQFASLTQHTKNQERDSSSDDTPKSRFSKRFHHVRVQHHGQQEQEQPRQQQPQQQQQQRQPVRHSQHKKSIEKRISDPGKIELIDDDLTQRQEASDDDSCVEASATQKRVPSLQLKHKQLKQEQSDSKNQPCVKLSFCAGIKKDLRGRLPHYLSDFTDGLSSRCAVRKTATTSFFLYFACLLPSIAIGTVNYDASGGYLDVKKTLCSQTIGGLTFALFGGQPMIVLMATVPLALYTKIVYAVSRDLDSEFEVLFAWTSLWNAIFLLSYALLDLGRCMKFSTRSIEEVFAMFIAASMIVYAFKDVVHDFRSNYYSNTCLLSLPQSKPHDVITAQNQLPFISMKTMNHPSTAQLHPQFDWTAANKTSPFDSLTGARKSDFNKNNKYNSSNNDRNIGSRMKRLIDVSDHHHRHHHRSRQRNDNDSKASVALPYEMHNNNNNDDDDDDNNNSNNNSSSSSNNNNNNDNNNNNNNNNNHNNHKGFEAKNKLSKDKNIFGALSINQFSSGSHDAMMIGKFDYSDGKQIRSGFDSTPNRKVGHTSSPDWRRRRGLSKPTPSNGSTTVTNPASIASNDSNNIKDAMTLGHTTLVTSYNRTSSSLPPSPSASSSSSSSPRTTTCTRESSLLCLLLTLATLWLSVFLYNFTKTPFLNASKRSLLADGALPVSVILASIVGSYVFVDVRLELVGSEKRSPLVAMVNQETSWSVVLCALPLGFLMSLLFFIDQAVVEGVVSYKENRLKKSQAINWDLFIISLINIILAFTGLPLVQPSLPQTPLHVHALADLEDRVDQGKVNQKIISVRETRVTALATHLLIGATIAAFEVLRWIPRPVLDGLLLHLAVIIMFRKNQLFDRILLLVTEQASYPPTHYIRTVPQRTIHLFTCVQLIQLLVLCCVAFSGIAYLQLAFPLLLILLLPMRYKLFAYLFERKYLVSLDGN